MQNPANAKIIGTVAFFQSKMSDAWDMIKGCLCGLNKREPEAPIALPEIQAVVDQPGSVIPEARFNHMQGRYRSI